MKKIIKKDNGAVVYKKDWKGGDLRKFVRDELDLEEDLEMYFDEVLEQENDIEVRNDDGYYMSWNII